MSVLRKLGWFRGSFVSLAAGIALLSLIAPLLPLASPDAVALSQRLLPPLSDGHLLGTDTLGRDVLARLLAGTRVSLAVALAAAALSAFFGTAIGALAGYFGGLWDNVLMRVIDLLMAFPYLIFALTLVAVLGPGLDNALIAIAVVNIPFFARTVRGVSVGLARRQFIDAGRVLGASHSNILFRHLLPNLIPTVTVALTTTFSWMLLETAGLSFLGLGAQPPQADLGSMLAEGRKLMLVHPHVALLPGLVIFILAAGINLLGDTLRDWLDPTRGD